MRYDYIEKGDCLELIKKIPDGSIDLILTDPPYGTMNTDGGRRMNINGWDKTIPTANMFEEISRVLRPNGKAVIFAQEPYTSHLITSAIPSLPFSQRLIWLKDTFANCLGVNKNCVNYYEDILLFSKIHPKHDFYGIHPLRAYSEKVYRYIGKTKKEIITTVGQCSDHFFRFNSTQFTLCTEDTYRKLIELFRIDEMTGFIVFSDLQKIDILYRDELIRKMNDQYPSVFNLWQGEKSKSNVLEYAKDYDGYHPTQKPVALLEDLIKTYSNEGDTVLDFTMGSGSTCVASINTNRHYIGFELAEKYFQIANERIEQTKRQHLQMCI